MAATRRVTIPYAPRRAFLPFHERTQRFAVGVAHRRCGKTVSCINDLIRSGLMLQRQHPPGRLAYIGPQLNQSKDNVWQYLKHYAAPVLKDKNEGDLWVELVNGTRIRLYGADNPDRIRGAYLDDVVLDEYADMHPGVWGTIVRPMLADYQGRATFIGTPKGRNAFFEQYQRALANPGWFTFYLPASETGILLQSELDAARQDMRPEEYEQEFECSFDAAILGAYYGKDIALAEREGRICAVAPDPRYSIQTAWDLGKGPNMAIWAFQALPGKIKVVGFLSDPSLTLDGYISEVRSRGWRGTAWLPHDAKIDVAGTGRTRVETMQAAGLTPRLIPMHRVDDGINAVRLLMPRMHFDEDGCKQGIEALRQYRSEYDEKKRVFKTTPMHNWASHPADAMRYVAMAWREVTSGPPQHEIPRAPAGVLVPRKSIAINGRSTVRIADLMPKELRRD